MNTLLVPYGILIIAYLLGSIPFGVIITKLAGLGDIRRIGSGNIGATNVLRTGRKDLAILTFILDGAKGAVAVLLAKYFTTDWIIGAAGLAALVGHLFPVWLKFRGGKGIAVGLGVYLAFSWPAGLATLLVWLMTAKLSGYSSLAGLVATALAPVAVWLSGHTEVVPWMIAMAVLVFIKHAENISRLVAGTEPKIGASRATPPA